ncbi:hypothetical protein SSX86_001623 [Deinandra increscens subsp. villosa]|uniref:Uncharacterized protein n=1 Tax=Deinandra increscens subsp. villosa TaxID=3103831 RepID=A0AAP0H9E1_9ASTR
MADGQDFEMWDEEFLAEAIQLTEAAVCSSSSASSSNPIQPPPQLFRPPPPPISYSPPRELSQRVKEENHRRFPDKGLDSAVSLNGINYAHSSRLQHDDDDKCSKQQEIDRLKDELGRVSKLLNNLEQECLDLRKDREKNQNNVRLVLPLNGSEDAETLCAKKSNPKNKDPIEDPSFIRPRSKGVIPCKTVGVQTDEQALSTDLTIKKNLSVSRKLAGIWEPQNDQSPRTNLVSKLFVACEADLQVLFGFLGLSIPLKKTTKMAPSDCIQSAEAAKVSHLYLTLTKISYDTGKLGDLLEALVDLCSLQNMMIVNKSLCVLHVVLKHIVNMENKVCHRDNVIINDPSTVNRSSEKHSEMGHLLCEITNETSSPHHPAPTSLVRAKKIQNKGKWRNELQPLISSSKWFYLFQTMHQVVTRHCQESIRAEAVSIMNILLLRTDAYTEREMYGDVAVFQSISQLLRKEAGIGVQKQAVHLLYLLLNCPNLMLKFCSSSEDEGATAEVSSTNAENALAFGSVLDGLTDCLACHGNVAPTTLVFKLQRKTIILLAFLASSGRHGFEILLGCNLSRTNFLYLILQILASEIDLETSERIQPPEDFRERTLLIREALILLNRLASNSQYSTPVLRVLTSRRDMAILTIDIASQLSRKNKWLWQSDTMTTQMRESEIVDLARIFKKRVYTFLGDAI